MQRSKWFSVRRLFDNAALLGIGAGWGRDDCTCAVIVMIGGWVISIGPHVPPNS